MNRYIETVQSEGYCDEAEQETDQEWLYEGAYEGAYDEEEGDDRPSDWSAPVDFSKALAVTRWCAPSEGVFKWDPLMDRYRIHVAGIRYQTRERYELYEERFRVVLEWLLDLVASKGLQAMALDIKLFKACWREHDQAWYLSAANPDHYIPQDRATCRTGSTDGLARPEWLKVHLYRDPRFAVPDRLRVMAAKQLESYKASQRAYEKTDARRKREKSPARLARKAERERQRRARAKAQKV